MIVLRASFRGALRMTSLLTTGIASSAVLLALAAAPAAAQLPAADSAAEFRLAATWTRPN